MSETSSRTLEQWFELYGESHRNKTNKTIHFIAVPTIYFSIIGLLWAIPVPAALAAIPGLNWAVLAVIPVLLFYRGLSMPVTIGMAVFSGACFAVLHYLQAAGLSVLWISVGLFVVMWILQFIGHAVEGKKPSFFQDLQFLLIGPAWVLAFLLRRAGIAH
ncbi:MAG: DUF962 domain-containing protein [Gammaproteobacteria bacterium]